MSRPSLGPCPNCTKARYVPTKSGLCTRCCPDYRNQHMKKRCAEMRAVTKFKRGCSGNRGYHEEPKKRTPIDCYTCFSLPWRRPLKGKCKCGKVWEAEPAPGRASVLGSAMGTVCRLGGR